MAPQSAQALSGQSAFNAEERKIFLAHLAETANVTASARKAGVSTGCVYAARRKSAPFDKAWHSALCEGYARLEADLLAEALRPAGSNIKDSTIKNRTMKTRLGLSLLTLHRASVRGEKKAPLLNAGQGLSKKPADVRKRLEARFAIMRERMAAADANSA